MKGICRFGLAALVLLLFAALEPVLAESKKVVLLHSFGQDFKPWSEYARTIRSELQRQSPWPLDITNHSLVTARTTNQDPEVPFAAYLSALFAEQQPDLIVCIGAPAAAFVQRHRPQLFANIPMVLTAVDERRVQFSALSKNDAVVPVRIDYLAAIQNILQVLPDTDNVTVVVGTSPIEQLWMEEIAKAVKPLTNRVSFTWTNHLSFVDLLKHAASLPPRSALFWELMIVDAAGVVHEGNTALVRLHAVSNAPIFSYDESFFGREIVGGPLLAVLDSSRQTAAVAVRMLGGEKGSAIKIAPVTFSRPKFDWREMQRWGISEKRLPLGSEVHFRELTVWARYRWQLTGVFIALLVQSAMITWLLIALRARRKAELESRQRSLEVMHLNRTAEVGALSASFAHEVSQPLVAVELNAERADELLRADPLEVGKLKEVVTAIRQANSLAVDVIRNLRNLLKRKSTIQDCDLNAVIADSVQLLSPEANKRSIDLRVDGIHQTLLVRADPVHLEQVVLNLVTNAMDAMIKSALGARKIVIQTKLAGESSVEVSVRDSGPGIPEHTLDEIFRTFYTTKEQGTGLGLSVARTIIETYDGKLWAENQAGGGAVFRFTLPLVRCKTTANKEAAE